ncbi:MAG: hypothetical protein A2Z86_10265 [Candidatus Glassbacteria bacterium GWA2_58_10]|uniref:Uncharacterized protein n=1 Tax=Candidatus Glassbacteria bacterium GWA2_58_10 TaxID=1817865 RepID=A0A1F5YGH8_9BACT|nr:MAG: hypothetical protein A2Z86_10265 [Candidatus Glassbacteria bacterium GWA2_58_10]
MGAFTLRRAISARTTSPTRSGRILLVMKPMVLETLSPQAVACCSGRKKYFQRQPLTHSTPRLSPAKATRGRILTRPLSNMVLKASLRFTPRKAM